MAAVGLYGTLAYAVARPTREIGVRLELGVRRAAVLNFGLRNSLRLAGAGITAYNGPALVRAGAVLTAMYLVAAFVPARLPSRIDPIAALKCE